jgi:hypothetical protein
MFLANLLVQEIPNGRIMIFHCFTGKAQPRLSSATGLRKEGREFLDALCHEMRTDEVCYISYITRSLDMGHC